MISVSRRRFLEAGFLGSALALLPRSLLAQRDRPNIVFIFIDDLGAEALGCYGGLSYETPRIDALASAGLRFDNCYASPLCTPSRVTTLTGRYPFRSGMGAQITPEPDKMLDPRIPTFATFLRDAGYRTAVSGKWQLARLDLHPDHPQRCGFDESFCWLWSHGGPQGARRYWGAEIVENGRSRPSKAEEYGPDLYSEFLIDFMERHRNESFLAYYPMTLVHIPVLPTPDEGMMAWLAEFGEVAQLMRHSVVDRVFGDWWFTAMVAYADKLVGRVIDALDRLRLRERTFVILSADNGTPVGFKSRLGDRVIPGGKDTLTEAGTRVPLIASWPGRVEAGVATDLVDLSDMFPTFAELSGSPGPVPEVDGISFAPRLLKGQPSRRRCAFAELDKQWFVRDRRWRLHDDGRLYDLRDRYSEKLADPGPEADAARQRLAAESPLPVRPGLAGPSGDQER